MSEEEKLTLDIEVDYDGDDDLERLENALDSVDRAIADTGKGRDEARVDTETDALTEAAKVETLDSAIDDLPDQKNVEIATSGGRGDLSDLEDSIDESDVMQRMSAGVGEGFRNQLRDVLDDTGVGATREDIDAVANELGQTATTSNPPTFPQGRFGEGAGSLTEGETQEIFGFLDGDEVQFTRADIGTVDTDEVLQPRGGASGLAAEGIDRGASLDLLQAQRGADDFRDNRSMLAQLGDQAREFGAEIKDARFTMEQFHAIFASLVPIAVVFIGAMPAAITALAGLAGAALAATAAVGGIGLLGLGGMALTGSGELDIQPILERMQGIFDTFITAFTPLMNRFQPLVESAFDTLEGLANPLASAMAPLTMFESTFEGLLNSIAGGLPSFTRNVIAFGQAAMPILSGVASFFANTEFMAFFVDQLGRAAGPLKAMAIGLKELVPFLLNLSQGFLAVVGFLTLFVGTIVGILDVVPFLATAIGIVTSVLLVMVSVTSLLTVLGFALSSSLATQAAAFLQTGAAAVASALGISTTTLAVIGLISAITLGVAALGLFAAGFDRLRERIGLATSELQKFNDVANSGPGSVGGQFGSPTGMGRGGGNAYNININASSPEESRRASNRVGYEMRRREQVNSVFGGN